MSSVYRVGLQLYGSAAGAVGAVNQTLTATTRLGQGFRTAAAGSTVLNNQAKALATTFRYALAGSVIFGITGALSKLSDFENQLGTLNSLMGELDKQGKFQGLGGQLDDLGSEALLLSNRFGAAVGDVESYMTRYASTFNRGKQSLADYNREMVAFTDTILNLQTALGTEAGDPAALASGIGGLVNVIPGGKKNPDRVAKQVSDYMAYLTQVTPNVTGTDLANAAGRMASVYNTTGMSPQQIFAIFGQAFKAGGSPTIAIRGVQQLLGQSLLTPKSAQAKAAFQRVVGTSDPNTLRNYSYNGDTGAFAVFAKLMDAVTPSGGFHYTPRQLQAAQAAGTKSQLQQALPGLDLTTLMSFFGRIQSVQQFVNILSQGGVQGLKDFVDGLNKANDANLTKQRADAALTRMGLTRLSTSMGNAMLSLVRPLNVPATALENHVVAPASNALAKHRTLTTVGEGLVAGAIGMRLLSGTALGRALKFDKIPLLGKTKGAAAAGVMAMEAANVAGGSTSPDGSMANPFWVIVSPYSSQLNPSGGATGTGGGVSGAAQAAEKKAGGSWLSSVWKKAAGATGLSAAWKTLGLAGAGVVGGAGVAVGAYDYLMNRFASGIPSRAVPKGHPLLAKYEKAAQFSPIGVNISELGPTKLTSSTLDVLTGYNTGKLTPALAEQLLSTVTAQKSVAHVQYSGTAKADFTIKLVDKNGNEVITVDKKGVPITKDSAPHAQGRPGVRAGK